MSWRGFLAGALLACALGVWVSEASAAGVPSALRAHSAALIAESRETLQVGYHGRVVGGYRGGYVHGYLDFYAPRYRGYAGWYPRSVYSFGLGYYRPFRGFYYSPSYFPSVYFSVAPAYYSLPVAGVAVGVARTVTIPETFSVVPPLVESVPAPVPVPVPSVEATFPYDGGPRRIVPMPETAPPVPVPVPVPRKVAPPLPSEPPPDNHAVVATVKATKFAYPAYGEDRSPSSFASDRSAPAKQQVVKKTSEK